MKSRLHLVKIPSYDAPSMLDQLNPTDFENAALFIYDFCQTNFFHFSEGEDSILFFYCFGRETMCITF